VTHLRCASHSIYLLTAYTVMNQHLQPASSVTQLVFKNTEGTSEGIIERITAINYSPKILISGIEFLYFTFNLP